LLLSLAVAAAVLLPPQLCVSTKKCPWTTSTFEALELAKQGKGFVAELEGNFASVAGPV